VSNILSPLGLWGYWSRRRLVCLATWSLSWFMWLLKWKTVSVSSHMVSLLLYVVDCDMSLFSYCIASWLEISMVLFLLVYFSASSQLIVFVLNLLCLLSWTWTRSQYFFSSLPVYMEKRSGYHISSLIQNVWSFCR
jgi:hypothetical protein